MSKPKRTLGQRLMVVCAKKKNTHWRSWPRCVKSYLAKEERNNCRMLFKKFGVKYWNEKKRLRVVYKIPWGVEFDVRNPAACPQAGRWNGALECFVEVWKNASPDEKREFVGQALPHDPRRN